MDLRPNLGLSPSLSDFKIHVFVFVCHILLVVSLNTRNMGDQNSKDT